MEFTELEREEFSSFALQHPLRHYFQTTEMETMSTVDGFKSIYVGVKENGKVVAASRLIYHTNRLGKNYFSAPRGLLLDYHNTELLTFFVKNLKKYLKKRHGFALHINPLVIHKQRDLNGNVVEGGVDNTKVIASLKALGFRHFGFTHSYDYSKMVRWVVCINLEGKTEEDLLKGMKASTRNLIRKAQKNQIRIRELSYEELPLFKKITEETSERRSFSDRDLTYYQNMYNLFSTKNQLKFLLAELPVEEYKKALEMELKIEEEKYQKLAMGSKGKRKEAQVTIESIQKKLKEAKELEKIGPTIPLAASAFLLFGGEIMYFYSGSYKKYMSFSAQYLIHWYMMQYGIQNHFERYNLSGITGNFDPSDPEYGLYEFKKGFGGVVEEYIGDFELPLSWFYYFQKLK